MNRAGERGGRTRNARTPGDKEDEGERDNRTRRIQSMRMARGLRESVTSRWAHRQEAKK